MNNMAGRLEKETIFYANMEEKLKKFPKIMSEYYTSMRANRISYMTIRVYVAGILHFANFVTKNNITEDFYKNITPTDIESYMISLETRQTKNGIQRTGDDVLQMRWTLLNRFFDWLLKRGYVENNPILTVGRPKNHTEHKVTYLTKEELTKLFAAVDKEPDRIASMRYKALFSLAVATGLRASALTNINKEDIDFKTCVINVIEKRQKVRQIPIGNNTCAVLKEWISVRDREYSDVESSALFLSKKRNRLSCDAVNDALKKYCNDAGINKKITLHKIRATTACTLAKNNIPIKAIARQLGHTNSTVTMRYIDVFNEDVEKSKNILDNCF